MSQPENINWHFICKQKNSNTTKDIVVRSNGQLLGLNQRKKNHYRNLLYCVCKAKINYIQSSAEKCSNENEERIENNDLTSNTHEPLSTHEFHPNNLSINDFDDNEIVNINTQCAYDISTKSSLLFIDDTEKSYEKNLIIEKYNNIESDSNIDDTYDCFSTL